MLFSGNSVNENIKFIWPRSAVLLLLAEILERKPQLMKPHKKRLLFGDIAKRLIAQGHPVSWETCERKWRALQTTYKKILNKENLSGSGNIHTSWEFFPKMEEILGNDPAYTPIVTGAAGTSLQSTILPQGLGASSRECGREGKANNKNSVIKAVLGDVNTNVKNLQTSIDKLVDVQQERNNILNRLTTAIENLANN